MSRLSLLDKAQSDPKVISMYYGSSTSARRWVRFDLILTKRDTYVSYNLNPRRKLRSRSTESKDILLWNISQMITKTVPNRMRIVISYVMKWDIPFWVYWKANGNWNNMIGIFQWRENHCKTNTNQKKEINPIEQDCVSHSQESE